MNTFKQAAVIILCVLAMAAILLTACSASSTGAGQPTLSLPTPTLNPIFYPATPASLEAVLLDPLILTLTPQPLSDNANPNAVSAGTDSSATSTPEPSPTTLPTETPTIEPTATITPTPTPNFRRVIIFDDAMNDKWAIKYSENVRYNERDGSVFHDGIRSLSFTPLKSFGTLLLTVRQTAKEEYLRSDAVGVRFWLYSGEQEIATSDLAVSVLGSNRFPFWIKDDHSVVNDQEPVFPETRLYYLDINKTIPANTWVEIEIWLDELVYEPEYQYITGIQIRNDEGFLGTVYLDQIELLMNPTAE